MRCALAFGTHGLDFLLEILRLSFRRCLRVSLYCFAASVVKPTIPSCNVLNRTLGLSDRNRVMPANVHFPHAAILVRHAKRSFTHTVSLDQNARASRPMSEYHNFCHCSRHRRGSLFGARHTQIVLPLRMARRPTCTTCGDCCGLWPCQVSRSNSSGFALWVLLRCLPVGTSQHVVQFCVSSAAGPA